MSGEHDYLWEAVGGMSIRMSIAAVVAMVKIV